MKVECQRGVSILKMNFDLYIFRAKQAQILHKFFLFLSNPRPRGIVDLIGCHVHANAWHVLGQMVKEFFISNPRVRFSAVAAVQPVHCRNAWRKVIEARIDARWHHRKLVNDLIQDNATLTESYKNHWEIRCRVFLAFWNVQNYVDWMIWFRILKQSQILVALLCFPQTPVRFTQQGLSFSKLIF